MGNDQAVVGIIDTGVAGSLLTEVDRAASASLVPGEGLTDVDGHGTEMAWIVRHAAPNARLVVVKAVDRHGATTDVRIAAAVEHLNHVGASVVLVSLAGAEPLPLTREAIDAAGTDGVLVVASAGNDGLDLGRAPSYPGGYRLPNLVTVAAVDSSGRLLGTSNHGGATSMVSPGIVPTCGLDDQPTTSVGTSGAAALVVGAAASNQGAGGQTMEQRVEALRGVHVGAPNVGCRSAS